MGSKDKLRLIPLAKEFMENKSAMDRIWGVLQVNSYIGKDIEGVQHRFVYADFVDSVFSFYNAVNTEVIKRDDKSIDEEIKVKDLCCMNTFKKCLKVYREDLGYITKGKIIDLKGEEVEVYYLKEDIKPFKMIPKETLEYLLAVSNSNVIKIYVYLLNCFSLKKGYRFSKRELSGAIGYSSKAFNKDIEYILESLRSCGLIAYHRERVRVSTATTSYYVLDNVRTSRTNKYQDKPIVKEKEYFPMQEDEEESSCFVCPKEFIF